MRLMLSIESLADQLGVKGQSYHIYELRSLLTTKCKAKARKCLPDVTIDDNDLQVNMSHNSEKEVKKGIVFTFDEEIGIPEDQVDMESDESEQDPELPEGEEHETIPEIKENSKTQSDCKKYKILMIKGDVKKEVVVEVKNVTENHQTNWKIETELENDGDSGSDWEGEGEIPQSKKVKQLSKKRERAVRNLNALKKSVFKQESSLEKWKCEICAMNIPLKKRAKHVRFHEKKLAEQKNTPAQPPKRFVSPLNGQFTCFKCKARFSHVKGLRQHVAEIHNSQRHCCPECDLVFGAKRYLQDHSTRIHPHIIQRKKMPPKSIPAEVEVVQIGGETKFPCRVCSKMFSSRDGILPHKRSLHPLPSQLEKWHKCPTCGKQFYRKREWNSHIRQCSTTSSDSD